MQPCDLGLKAHLNVQRENITIVDSIDNVGYNCFPFRDRFVIFFHLFQIIRVEPVAAAKTRRPGIQQMHDSKIKFPLPARVQKSGGSLFKARRPNTYFL